MSVRFRVEYYPLRQRTHVVVGGHDTDPFDVPHDVGLREATVVQFGDNQYVRALYVEPAEGD